MSPAPAAGDALCCGRRPALATQYDARRDEGGWTVFDRWTGEAVVLLGAEQAGMAWLEAQDLIERLNRRRADGDRSILQ